MGINIIRPSVDISSLVPYSGADNALDMGSYDIKAGSSRIVQSNLGIGTISIVHTDTRVVGSGTTFLTTFSVGSTIVANGETRTIATVDSDVLMTTDAWVADATNVEYRFVGVGTISVTASGIELSGNNTAFLTTFSVGSTIVANGETRTIATVDSDTLMTTDAWVADATNVAYTVLGVGTISVAVSTSEVVGTNTKFINSFNVGNTITADSETHTISAINSDTLLITDVWTSTASNLTYTLVGGDRVVLHGNGNIGVGTIVPIEKLHVADGNILGTGTFSSGRVISTSGAGTRLMWYPRKSAFRAGTVSGTEWDDVNIGDYSAAFGRNNIASGLYSFTAGRQNNNNGDYASVFGYSNNANASSVSIFGSGNDVSGNYATAFGASHDVTGASSTATGNNNTITSTNSFATGTGHSVAGNYSAAFGLSQIVSGQKSAAFGSNNTASGYVSFTAGGHNIAGSDFSVAFGLYAEIPSTALRSIQFGYSDTNNIALSGSDLFVIYGDAGYAKKVGIQTLSPTARLHIGAGTADTSSAPMKLTSGVNLTTPEAGAVEYDGTNLYVTDSNLSRKPINNQHVLASKFAVNMDTSADQSIVIPTNKYIIRKIITTNASIPLSAAQGGLYTAVSKGGTAIVAAAQVYSALTTTAKFLDLTLETVVTTDVLTATTLYFSLTNVQGAAATADIYIIGDRLDF